MLAISQNNSWLEWVFIVAVVVGVVSLIRWIARRAVRDRHSD